MPHSSKNGRWSILPNHAILRAIAAKYLLQNYIDIHVQFHAQGHFHRIYLISMSTSAGASSSTATEYIIRVALPVEPFFKTESEVATIAYVAQNTTIPVPTVIAYDSCADNELGFEWILMDRIQGVALTDVWDSLPFDSKASITLDIASYLRQLQKLKFSQIGSLYYSSIQNKTTSSISTKSPSECNNFIDTNKFVMGKIVSPSFFLNNDDNVNIRSEVSLGPFTSSKDFITAKTHYQIQRLKKSLPFLPLNQKQQQLDKLETCQKLLHLIPQLFKNEGNDENEYILSHPDLSSANILVDPTTHYITGIIDWESCTIVPKWEQSFDVPPFLWTADNKSNFSSLSFLSHYSSSSTLLSTFSYVTNEHHSKYEFEYYPSDNQSINHFENIRLRYIFFEKYNNNSIYHWLDYNPTSTIIEDKNTEKMRLLSHFSYLLHNIEIKWENANEWIQETRNNITYIHGS